MDQAAVDGARVDVLSKPWCRRSAQIGGQTAAVQYAGAAPYNMPGLFRSTSWLPSDVEIGLQRPGEGRHRRRLQFRTA
jgi:hypothetical protein